MKRADWHRVNMALFFISPLNVTIMRSLIELGDNQPNWVNTKLGITKFNEFSLGDEVNRADEKVTIIHIQKVDGDTFFRLRLDNGASVTAEYDILKMYNP